MKHLNTVILSSNKLTTLPSWVQDWGLDIVWDEYAEENFVSVEDNPFNNPPVEIIKGGNKAIKDWFAATGT